MDSTQQTTYGFTLPALDPFGGEHFAADVVLKKLLSDCGV